MVLRRPIIEHVMRLRERHSVISYGLRVIGCAHCPKPYDIIPEHVSIRGHSPLTPQMAEGSRDANANRQTPVNPSLHLLHRFGEKEEHTATNTSQT